MAGLSFWSDPVKASWDRTGVPQAAAAIASQALSQRAVGAGYRAFGRNLFAGKLAGAITKQYTQYPRWRSPSAQMPYARRGRRPYAGRRRFTGRRGMPNRFRGYYRKVGVYGRFNNRAPYQEKKWRDIAVDMSPISSTGTIDDTMCLIAQDVDSSARIGRRCTIRSIFWRWMIFLPEVDAAATASPPDVVRLMIVQDTQCNGVIFTPAEVLVSADFQAYNNLSNRNRFKILCDKSVSINYNTLASDNAGVVSSAQHQRIGSCYLKNVNITITYDNTAATGAIGTRRSNNIAIMCISQNGVARLGSVYRIRFTDD